MLILVLVLKDYLRTNFKSLSLSLSSWLWSLSLSWSLWVQSLLTLLHNRLHSYRTYMEAVLLTRQLHFDSVLRNNVNSLSCSLVSCLAMREAVLHMCLSIFCFGARLQIVSQQMMLKLCNIKSVSSSLWTNTNFRFIYPWSSFGNAVLILRSTSLAAPLSRDVVSD